MTSQRFCKRLCHFSTKLDRVRDEGHTCRSKHCTANLDFLAGLLCPAHVPRPPSCETGERLPLWCPCQPVSQAAASVAMSTAVSPVLNCCNASSRCCWSCMALRKASERKRTLAW